MERDGTVWEGDAEFPKSKDDMDLYVYFSDVKGNRTTVELGETIAHELALHGYKYGKHIEAIMNGTKNNQIPTASMDHKVLKNSDIENIAYKTYKGVMDQLIKINPNYKKEMDDDKNRKHK